MNNYLHRIHHPTIQQSKPDVKQKQLNQGQSFQEILQQQQLKVSKHAKTRLAERNISITEEQWQTITNKLQEAKQKGVRESVVVLNNATLLANAQKNTIITALNRDEAESRIFTNINGTIIL